MTDQDRALWAAAQDDYTKALKIAAKAWAELEGEISEVNGATIQAGAATILIHITKLRAEERVHIRLPEDTGPRTGVKQTANGSGQTPSPAPPCPNCGGKMWDNRKDKKSPKHPDFKCRNKECKDDKGFTTGLWEKDLQDGAVTPKPKARGAVADHVGAAVDFNDFPKALDDDDDDLPF